MILPQIVYKGDKNDVVNSSNVGNGPNQFPAWMLGRPKDVGTKSYVAVTYESFDDDGSSTGGMITEYFPISDPVFTFEPGESYALHVKL